MFSHKRTRTLRSTFQRYDADSPTDKLDPRRGMFSCGKCVVCPHILTGSSYCFPHNGTTVTHKSAYDCHTEFVVYAAICSSCSSYYVGKTIRRLSDRAKEHLAAIRNNDSNNALGRHSTACHNFKDFNFFVLEQVSIFFGDRETLLELKELKWQILLNAETTPGLNENVNLKCALKWYR